VLRQLKYDPATAEMITISLGHADSDTGDFVVDEITTAREKAEKMLAAKMEREFAQTAELTDEEMTLAGAAGLFDEWTAGVEYAASKRMLHGGQVYVVRQDHTSQAHQPPGAEGMFAVYQPVGAPENVDADGSMDHPFALVAGMEGVPGKFYLYGGAVWECLRAMQNVLESWLPGKPGMETYWREA
jgi:hypothetical protein